MMERFYWWIGMEYCFPWWIWPWFNYHVEKHRDNLFGGWSVIGMHLPDVPGEPIAVDKSGLLRITKDRNECLLLVADRKTPHSAMYAMIAVQCLALCIADIFVDDFILKLGYHM